LILKAAEAEKEARKRADLGDFGSAQRLLLDSATGLRDAAPRSQRAVELLSEADLLEGHAAQAAPTVWDSMASKRAHYSARRKSQGRRRPRKPDQD
jgi:hypothetical protein